MQGQIPGGLAIDPHGEEARYAQKRVQDSNLMIQFIGQMLEGNSDVAGCRRVEPEVLVEYAAEVVRHIRLFIETPFVPKGIIQ